MRRTTLILATLVASTLACSEPQTKQANRDTNNGTDIENDAGDFVPNNNDGNCDGRLCPGECLPNGDGWCVVENFTRAFHIAMWVHSPDEIWLADQAGMVRTGAGTTWEEHPVPGIEQILDIIGTGSGQVWVSTHPAGIFRWEGSTWIEETIVDPPDELGFGRFAYDDTTDTLFVASQEAIYQRVGEQWEFFTAIEGGELRNVTNCGGTRWFAAGYPVTVDESGFASRWGVLQSNSVETANVLTSGDIVAGGDRVIFYDGAFKSLAASFPNDTHALAGTSLSDIWSAVDRGNGTEIWHYDGRVWSLVKEYDILQNVGSLYTEVEGRVRVTFEYGVSDILLADGTVLETIGVPGAVDNFDEIAAHHVSMDEYWIVDSGLARWTADGGWEENLPGPSDALSVWGLSIDETWFVTSGGEILRGNTEDYQQVDTGFEQSETLQAVRGTDAGHVWVAGSDQVLQWDGAQWTDHVDFDAGSEPSDGPVSLTAVGDEAWVFRRNDVFHWDGTQWNHIPPQRHVIRVGCEDGELVAMASNPPAILRGAPDRLKSFGDMAEDGSISASRAWMTSESDAWLITRELPFVHRWTGDEFATSLDIRGDQLLDIEVLPSGQAYLLGEVTLYTRQPQ